MKILFLGETDSTVSQIAKALLKRINPALKVYSAGLAPSLGIHPFVYRVLGESGLSLTEQRPQSTEKVQEEEFDFVISFSCDETSNSFTPKLAKGGFFRNIQLPLKVEPSTDLTKHLARIRWFKVLLGEVVTDLYLTEFRPVWEKRV